MISFKLLNLGHDRFEIDHIIAASGTTRFGVYVQCLREIHVRVEALENGPQDLRTAFLATRTRVLELQRLYSIAKYLEPEFEGISQAQYDTLCEERSVAQFTRQIYTQVTLFGSISPDLAQVITQLPLDQRMPLISLSQDPERCNELMATSVCEVDFSAIPTLELSQINDPSFAQVVGVLESSGQPVRLGLPNN